MRYLVLLFLAGFFVLNEPVDRSPAARQTLAVSQADVAAAPVPVLADASTPTVDLAAGIACCSQPHMRLTLTATSTSSEALLRDWLTVATTDLDQPLTTATDPKDPEGLLRDWWSVTSSLSPSLATTAHTTSRPSGHLLC